MVKIYCFSQQYCFWCGVCVPERIRIRVPMHAPACVCKSIAHRMFIWSLSYSCDQFISLLKSAFQFARFYFFLFIIENADYSIWNLKIFSFTWDCNCFSLNYKNSWYIYTKQVKLTRYLAIEKKTVCLEFFACARFHLCIQKT